MPHTLFGSGINIPTFSVPTGLDALMGTGVDPNANNPEGTVAQQDDADFPNDGDAEVIGVAQSVPITQQQSIPFGLILSIVGIIIALMVLLR